MGENEKPIAQRIRETRVRLKMSQNELARQLGVSRETVSRWENGKFKPLPAFRRMIRSFELAEE